MWFVVVVALMGAAFSFAIALQGKTLEGVVRGGGKLELILPGHAPLPVTSLRQPAQVTPFQIQPSDVATQTDAIDTYENVAAYLPRQDKIMQILSAPVVIVGLSPATGTPFEREVKVVPLTIRTLDVSFWVSLFVGVTACLIGGWVWCLKPDEPVTQLLAVNGLGMLIASVSSSADFAHPLALPSRLISTLTALNHAGTLIFGLTLVGIFLLFPKPLISTRQYGLVLMTGPLLFVLDQMNMLGFPGGIILFCFAVLVIVAGLVAIQFWNTRGAPNLRASLLWLGLAVVLSGGLWGVTIAAYMLQGRFQNMPESYIFLSFLILYLGIAVGVARFRLFDIGDWAFRIFFYIASAFLFICLDAVLIYLTGMTQNSALALALLITAFGYLPLRDLLWRRFTRANALSENELFGSVLEMAFAPESSQRQSQWHDLLERLFVPLSIAPATRAISDTHMDKDGLHLYVPGNLDAPALQLSYPQSGRGLFAPRHVDLVNHILRLSRKAAQGLTAYERGAAEQRQRLAQDLHDDVGAKLVSGLIVADEASRPFIYSALSDIREIAAALVSEKAPLDRTIADMRHEAVRRLDAAKIELEWPLWPEDAAFVELTALQKKALASTVRETITNIIKHSGATCVTALFKVDQHTLTVHVTDNGSGFPDSIINGHSNGQGLKSITNRLAQMDGKVRFENRSDGAVVAFDLPLKPTLSHKKGAHI